VSPPVSDFLDSLRDWAAHQLTIEGMALQTSLHPNSTDLLPKMLLGIPDDLLGYVVRQRVVCLIMNGDARHGDAPLP
jgi:hypothetical protein